MERILRISPPEISRSICQRRRNVQERLTRADHMHYDLLDSNQLQAVVDSAL